MIEISIEIRMAKILKAINESGATSASVKMTGILIKSRTSGIKVFLLAKVALRILQYFRSEFRSEEQPALPIDPFSKI